MKVATISDTHARHKSLTSLATNLRLPEADVLIHAGDFTPMGRRGETVDFIKWFNRLPYAKLLLIAGNHDMMCQDNPDEFRRILAEYGENITYLENAGVEVGGIKFWGSPVTPRFHDWAFGWDLDQRRTLWNNIPADTDVVITHGPPHGIRDRCIPSGDLAGCPALAARLLEIKPKYHVHGHIHEGYGTSLIDGTWYVNSSFCDRNYEARNQPHVFNV